MAIIGIRPTVDVVFKCIFGNEGHPELTRVLLNAVIPLIGSPRVIQTRVQNPFSFAEFESDKEIVVDVHVRDERDDEYQIEMQVEYHANLPRRVHDNRHACTPAGSATTSAIRGSSSSSFFSWNDGADRTQSILSRRLST